MVIAELASHARAAGRLGIDTEFVSESRYRALLCLVQVVVPLPDGGQQIEVLDALDGFDPSPLAEVLADPAIEVVMHAGRQDVAILRRCWGTPVAGLFDTQVAAGFAGLGAQTGYVGLLADVLGVRVAKTASFTRWDARPLTAEQLSYAREDVERLLELADAIGDRLRASGRLAWAVQECAIVERSSDERDPETVYERLPRIARLDKQSVAVARELAAWRERTAERLDKPVSTVLPDPSLLELAKRKPAELAALEHIRGLHAGRARQHGKEILAAIERGREAPPIVLEVERSDHRPGDAPLVALAEALVRQRALEAKLAYELVASRADLTAIVRAARAGGEAPVRTLEGWRRELVGGELLTLLAGSVTLAVGADGALRIS